ncbi:MAG: 50S ribosomal protein L24 [Bifidobacteriaceae bacterium]|jgi:large subunit ribosomal protein L24|nr:50S ribosomal protein L24 [Bifidobacteriaceae bacterium]
MKIHKNDIVMVISGKDKGKQGRVLEVLKKREALVVEGIQRVTRHTKETQTQRGTKKGGVETFDSPIHVSNVMAVDSNGTPTRIGKRVEQVNRNGKLKTQRIRIAKITGNDLEDRENE